MKTKKFVLLIFLLMMTVFVLNGCSAPSKKDFVVEESRKIFNGWLDWGEEMTTWTWYEGNLSGVWSPDGSGENLRILGKIWWGGDGKQNRVSFDGEVGPYALDVITVREGGNYYLKVKSFESRRTSPWNSSSAFLETVLKTASRQPNTFIYLRNFSSSPWISLIVQAQQTLNIILPFITFPAESCNFTQCPIIIDTDLLGSLSWDKSKIYTYLQAAKKKDIEFSDAEHKVLINQLESSGLTIRGDLTDHEIHLQTQSLGLSKRTMKIDLYHDIVNTVLDITVYENQKRIQQWKAVYDLNTTGWSLIIHQLMTWSLGSVRASWNMKGEYIPISILPNIDVYNLLGK
jgi:hypothetical protein